MFIKNSKISFDRQEGEKIVFRTESGAEISLDNSLLEKIDYQNKDLYISLGDQESSSSDEQKKLLNELLEEDAK
ncbi:hypothetical protein C0580_04590 [Candidatus Parcubacteria bacterium]|nr:MAG: hypothetical protein C0580_04590 [Candidatus Parcubacteria bacterium]